MDNKNIEVLPNTEYYVFTKGTKEERAIEIYTEKFGVEPENIHICYNGQLWLGPIKTLAVKSDKELKKPYDYMDGEKEKKAKKERVSIR